MYKTQTLTPMLAIMYTLKPEHNLKTNELFTFFILKKTKNYLVNNAEEYILN